MRCAAQEDSWAVITSYFEEKGLVRQQLESFDEFINSQMQEIVDENDEHIVTPQQQVGRCPPGHLAGRAAAHRIYGPAVGASLVVSVANQSFADMRGKSSYAHALVLARFHAHLHCARL